MKKWNLIQNQLELQKFFKEPSIISLQKWKIINRHARYCQKKRLTEGSTPV